MSILGKFSSKMAAAAGRWILKSGFPASWFPRGLDAFGGASLENPMEKSAWVLRAIKKVSGPIAAVECCFSANGQEVELPNVSALLKNPINDPSFSFSDLVEASVGWRKLKGECFWILGDDSLLPFKNAAGSLSKIIVARPDRMREVVESGELIGWVYTSNRGAVNLLPEQVIQSKNWNPYNQFRGLAEYLAAQTAAEADLLAGTFAKNLMANNGDTGPYIVAKSGVPSDAQREQIIADLKAKRAAQLRGDFRPMFLTGDITVTDPAIKSADASFIGQRISNRQEIAAAFGVPPSMFEVKATYSIGSASDYYQLISDTCLPESVKIAAMIEQLILRLTGLVVSVEFDWDDHPVMQEVRKERLGSVDVLWNKGMPLEKISDYLRLDLPEFPGWEKSYLPFSVSPASESSEAASDLAEADHVEPDVEPDSSSPVLAAIRSLQNLRAAKSLPLETSNLKLETCSCGCSPEDSAIELKGRPAAEIALWKSGMADRRATIKALESKFNRVLMRARAETLRKLSALGSKSVVKSAADEVLFDLVQFAKELNLAFKPVLSDALKSAGTQVFNELNKPEVWSLPDPRALEFLATRENKITGASETIFEQIRGVIEDGLDAGTPMEQVIDAVKAEFNGISDKRAKMIAMTETSSAYGFGRHEAMKAAKVQWKKWLTSANQNVRPSHRAMNGQIVPIYEPFVVVSPKGDVDSVMHPGDPSGAAWNVINCHCVEVASAQGPEGEVELA